MSFHSLLFRFTNLNAPKLEQIFIALAYYSPILLHDA